MIKTSFGLFVFTGNEFSFSFYKQILSDKSFYESLLYTIYLGIVPTILATFIGVGLAITTYMVYKKDKRIFSLAKFPNVIPYSIYTFAVILFVMQTGLFCRILCAIGIIDSPSDFPLMIYDKFGIGIMIVYLLKQVPFIFFVVFGALNKVGRKYIDTAYSLGASSFTTALRVVLPSIKSSVVSVFLLCFSFNFGSFEVPYLIGSPKYETLPIMSYKYYVSQDLTQRPLSMVINVIILIICCVMLAWYVSYSNKEAKYEKI